MLLGIVLGCVIINGQAVDLPRNVSTVAERLSKGGFQTAAFGKWDAGMTTWDYTPTCRGFDYFYGFYGPAQVSSAAN
jgi:arylsulfatase A-like enzyme